MTSLSHLRELLAKGTPGEWKHDNHGWSPWVSSEMGREWPYQTIFKCGSKEDADTVVASHNALPDLLEIAEAALRWRDAVSDSERGAAILALSNATFKVKP